MATQREAIFWGAIAGAGTLLAEALTLDPASLFVDFDLLTFLGYCAKALILMALGAIVVKVNQETNIQKAFQLGVMAPALIIGLQSGANLNKANSQLDVAREQIQELQAGRPQQGSGISFDEQSQGFFIRQAYAADAPRGRHEDISAVSRFLKGLKGSNNKSWFVVAGAHRNRDSAERQASKYQKKGWDVKVGSKISWDGFYVVLLGSNLTKSQALAIRDRAIREGLPRSTYVWKK